MSDKFRLSDFSLANSTKNIVGTAEFNPQANELKLKAKGEEFYSGSELSKLVDQINNDPDLKTKVKALKIGPNNNCMVYIVPTNGINNILDFTTQNINHINIL